MALFSRLENSKQYFLLFLLFILVCIVYIPSLITTLLVVRCTNKSPFPIAHDFSNAYAFVMQKRAVNAELQNLLSVIPSYSSCLDIERADLDEQYVGFSIFYPDSTLQRLHIFVDFLYRSQDPVLTGYVLVGKLARANDFVEARSGIVSENCNEQSVHEEQAQLIYLTSLTPSEENMLKHYITSEFYNYKDIITKKILKEQLNEIDYCSSARMCSTIIINFLKTHNEALDSDTQCFKSLPS